MESIFVLEEQSITHAASKEIEKDTKNESHKEWNLIATKKPELGCKPSVRTGQNKLNHNISFGPRQSPLIADSPSWPTESLLFKKPVLERVDILHNYITGENEYSLITEQYTGQPLIETKLDDKTTSFGGSSGFVSNNTNNVGQINNTQAKKKVPDALRGFFDKYLGKLFGKSVEKTEKPQDATTKTSEIEEYEPIDSNLDPNLSLGVHSTAVTDASSLISGSTVEWITDYDSFISDDCWLFNVVSAQKFKYLCSNCSEHFWEESGKIPNIQ